MQFPTNDGEIARLHLTIYHFWITNLFPGAVFFVPSNDFMHVKKMQAIWIYEVMFSKGASKKL